MDEFLNSLSFLNEWSPLILYLALGVIVVLGVIIWRFARPNPNMPPAKFREIKKENRPFRSNTSRARSGRGDPT